MVKAAITRTLLCGALALAGAMAPLASAEAGAVRVRFTPDYGPPFTDLHWWGEAVINDGNCDDIGNVSNLYGGCANQFTITSAFVEFESISNTSPTGRIDFEGGHVISVNRVDPEPPGWRQIVSTPLNPARLPDGYSQTEYEGEQAYFSLVFVGGYAQLYWFEKDPGPFGDPWWNIFVYKACYLVGTRGDKVCGLSDSDEVGGNGAKFTSFAAADAVPEPGTLALVLAAALGIAGVQQLRRSRSA